MAPPHHSSLLFAFSNETKANRFTDLSKPEKQGHRRDVCCLEITQKDADKDEGPPERPRTLMIPSHLELRPVCSVELPMATVINLCTSTDNYRDCL